MTDILAALDAAIDGISQNQDSTDRSSRALGQRGPVTGTANALTDHAFPADPVVPVPEEDTYKTTITHNVNTIDCDRQYREIGLHIYPLNNTVTAGTTGNDEASCASPSVRNPLGHWTYGNSSALAQQALHIDFETRSALDLKQVGLYVYAEHFSTDVWVACYAIGGGPVRAWHPGDPVPADLVEHVRSGRPLVAHNAAFERTIWLRIMTSYGWPEPDFSQWHCTAAMAAAMALPRSLEDAAKIAGCSFQKDLEGRRLMLQIARPRAHIEIACRLCGTAPGQPTQPDCACHNDPTWRREFQWMDDQESVERGTAYCIRDVETERELLTRLRLLTPFEREVWLLDQRINDRGIAVDLPVARNASAIVEERTRKLNAEIGEVTGGAVRSATQIAKLIDFLKDRDVALPGGENDLGKEEVEVLLGRNNLPSACRRALEIRLEAAKTSTSKLNAMNARTSADGRMRDNLLYQGASRTGRWSGHGLQAQNLPRGGLKLVEEAIEVIGMGWSEDDIACFLGPPLEVISGCLRGMLVAASGYDLMCADYNAIEARGSAWLANAEGLLDVFRREGDP
jgi:DNA polymerase bacteriophage-type